MRQTTDVVVVGGGPAGLAAAIVARLRGMQVLVQEAARPPIEKVCGEGLMPDALAALRRLGISLTPEHGAPFVGIRFVDRGQQVEARFPHGLGVGVRRPLLHACLVERARALGVTVFWGTPVRAITPTGLHSPGLQVGYRWLIAADGRHSATRRRTGLHQGTVARRRLGLQRHYRVTPWSDCVDIHWGHGCQACITPVSPDEVCVCFLTQDPTQRFATLFRVFPQVAARLAGAVPTTAVRGAVAGTQHLVRVTRDNVALIGDAAGAVDAISGEGLCLAFQQAEQLSEALAAGDLARYARAHRRLMRRPRLMAALLLLMAGRAWLRGRTLRTLAAEPTHFARLLALHVGQRALPSVGWKALLTFGWQFLVG